MSRSTLIDPAEAFCGRPGRYCSARIDSVPLPRSAMAQTLFGDDEKAKHWLSKSKDRFSGKSPIAMLSTTQGTRLIEELLIQTAEGFVGADRKLTQ